MITLTEIGRKRVEDYIHQAEAKRKEILDARLDIVDETELPTIEAIIDDIDCFDTDGEYCNGWGVTDNYDMDYPLYLKCGEDYIYE